MPERLRRPRTGRTSRGSRQARAYGRRPSGRPLPVLKLSSRFALSLVLISLVWLSSFVPAARAYLRMCFVPGAAVHSAWVSWLDWQPAGEKTQPVWVAVTGRADKAQFDLPVDGEIIAVFGWGNDLSLRDYIIIKAEPEAVVHSVLAGRVVDVQATTTGTVVTIDHGADTRTMYGNCHNSFVSVGDRVKPNEAIARLSSSGELVFQLLAGGKPVDPLPRTRPGVR